MANFTVTDSRETEMGKNSEAAEKNGGKSRKRKLKTDGADAPKKKKPRKQEESEAEQVYDVEYIMDHKIERKKHFYLVKWENWDSKYNTWEPSDHLEGCSDALFSFLDNFICQHDFNEQEYVRLKSKISNISHEDLQRVLPEYVTPKGIIIPPPELEKTNERLKIVSRWPENVRDPNVEEMVRKEMIEANLYEVRQNQLDRLKQWEEEMNCIIALSKCTRISVVNNVDLEGPPSNFIYINHYLPGEKVNIPEEPPVGCVCEPCTTFKKKCCPTITGSTFAYDRDGRLKVPQGTPIYECNKRCRCGPECFNRVVQKGRSVKLSIFRTSSGCGWGVKALETIPKGAFVSEYVGEVITFEEAEKRGKEYDKDGQTYLFDLDFNDTNSYSYTVDAAKYGNISHFVNHSCDPNMTVYAVFIDCLDPNLPKLALFANREIKQGEEISFDYLNQSRESHHSSSTHKEQTNGVVMKNGDVKTLYNMVCKCGSKKCRKFYL